MTWYDQVTVLGGDSNQPIGAVALAGDGRSAFAGVDGIITWAEDNTEEVPVVLEANGYINQTFIFRRHKEDGRHIPTVLLEKYVKPQEYVPPPTDLRVADFWHDIATLEWENGEEYDKVLLRWAVIQPDGQRTNPQQLDLDGNASTHDVILPGNTYVVFSVKGGRQYPLSYVYSDWSAEALFRTPPRSAFTIHPDRRMQPGAEVTALAPWGNGHVDLFATDADGTVWSTFWDVATSWVPWFPIHPDRRMYPGASITAYAPPWGKHIDLFVTDTEGTVWSTYWEKKTSWVPWFPIHPEVKAHPGAPVTALVTHPGHYDVFVTNSEGAVLSTYWEKKTDWVPWFEPHPDAKAQPGARVTALVPWGNDHIDLFVTDTEGTVRSTHWEKKTKWVPWFPIHPEDKMQPGATVTAMAPRQGKDGHIDLFTTGTYGEVYHASWEEKTQWTGWQAIHRERVMQPGATVAALNTRANHVDIFVTDGQGLVWSSLRDQVYDPNWADWFGIHHDTVQLGPGAPIAALVPHPEHIDLFATDSAGTVWSMNWQPNTGW